MIHLLLFALLTAAPQQREFLTSAEIELIREAQEPDDRMKAYVDFARVRLDSMDKELEKKESAERGGKLHDLLYQYDRIVDAIDDVVDLAHTKHVFIRKGLDWAVRGETEFLKRLQTLEEKHTKDAEEYKFMLHQALETTQSSLEDLKERLSKLPADKKLEKKIEKEAQQEEKARKKNEKPPE